jgi:DNA polymerase-3 subunit chi
MTRIDFYVLTEETAIVRLHYACRLAEKAFHHGHTIVIAVDDESQASNLSEYLWSFKPESFLPHQLQTHDGEQQVAISLPTTPPPTITSPIIVVWDQGHDDYHDILINLGHAIPDGFSRFQRVIEIVVQEKSCLASTRSHFQFYRERGYPLKSHSIEGQ